MIEPIILRFATAGMPEVNSAFARIGAQAKKFEESMVATSEKGSRARAGVADKEARERIKVAQRADKEVEKAQRAATQEQEREAKRRADIVRRTSEMAGRDAVKAAREEAREIERIEEQKMRVRIRSSEMAGQAAARAAAESMRANEKAALQVTKYGKTWAGRIGSAASVLGATAGLGGAFAAAGAIRGEMSDERKAALLVNQVTTGARPPAGADVKSILGQAGAVSKDTGTDRGDVVEAALTYAQNARRGDFKGAMGNMGFFAKMSKVTGVDMSELAGAAGTLQSQNADLGPEQMQQMLLNAYSQSKQGSMSLADAVKTMGVTGSTRSSFSGDVTENQRQLLGFAQIAKSGGDAGEAGTFVKDIALEAEKANKKFRKEKGSDLFKTDQYGRIASPESLVADVFKNTKGNIQEINSLFGARGGAMFRELENSYVGGAGKSNDVNAGVAAVVANMREVTGSTMSASDLDSQFQQTMSQPAEKFGSAMNQIEESLKEHLAPALETFAAKLSDPKVMSTIDTLITGVGKLADYFLQNPLAGIGQIVALAVTKDIASAAIGQGIKSLLTSILNGASGGAGGLGALGKVGAGLAIAAGATAITIAGMDAIDAHNAMARNAAGRETMTGVQGSIDAQALARKAKSGTVTASDLAKASAAAEAQAKVVAEKEAAMKSGPGLIATVTGVSSEVAADQKAQYALQKAALDDMIKSIKDASDALGKMKGAVPGAVPPVSAGAPATPISSAARSG